MATSTRPRERRPSLDGGLDSARPARRLGPAGRVVVVGGTCFLVWTLLAAPALRRSAQTAPLGLRRSAALAVLGPIARVSVALGLDRVQSVADAALGRNATPATVETFPRERPGRPGARRPAASAPADSSGGGPSPSPGARHAPTSAGSVLSAVLPRPASGNRLRVLVIGDSIGEDLGIGLGRLLDEKDAFVTKVDARQSTGLARPDYFDWFKQEALDIRSFHPDVVIAMFGGNDNQGFIVSGEGYAFGSPSWTEIYAGRVAAIMSAATARNASVIWVGMPPMRDGGLSSQVRTLNSIYRAVAARHAGVAYVDSWPLLSGPKGGYAPFLQTSSGQEELVREPDGVHLTVAGSSRLAAGVFAAMRELWQGLPPSPTSPPSPTGTPAPTPSTSAAPPAGKASLSAG